MWMLSPISRNMVKAPEKIERHHRTWRASVRSELLAEAVSF